MNQDQNCTDCERVTSLDELELDGTTQRCVECVEKHYNSFSSLLLGLAHMLQDSIAARA